MRTVSVRTGALAAALLSWAGAATAEILTPPCDWPVQVAPGASNVFYPDAIASYWVLPFTVQDDLRIVVSGIYPEARYASFNVYTDSPQFGSPFTGNGGLGSSLADHRIEPDAGSVNPWQQPALPGGRFTVTLRQDAVPGDVNTLPLSPPGTSAGNPGWIIYRIYLPAGGPAGDDYYDFDRIPLPTVTFERNGESRQVPPCPGRPAVPLALDPARVERLTASDAVPAPARRRAPPSSTADRMDPLAPLPGENWFYRPPNEEFVGGFPNAESAYVGATAVIPPPERDVIVIRGKAPRHPPGLLPSLWPAPGQLDVRYWSMCMYTFFSLDAAGQQQLTFPLVVNQLPDGTVEYGCRHDDITALDADGFYTYVVGNESQRARVDRIPGATFLPFSTVLPATPHNIYLRNMVPADDFEQGCHYVPYERNPDAAAAVMGPYYPKTRVCSLAALTREGGAACLTTPSIACAFEASQQVVIGPRTKSLDADVFARDPAGSVQIGRKVKLGAGTLVAGAQVLLGTDSSVFDVDAPGLGRAKHVDVRGTIGTAPPPAASCAIPDLMCAGGTDGVVLKRGDPVRTLPPGNHGALRMASRTQLALEPGRHVFCSIVMGRSARLTVGGAALTTIDVAGPVRLGKNSRVGPAGAAPTPRLRIGGPAPGPVRIGAGARVQALVRAPDGEVEVGRGADLVGSVCSRTLRTRRNVVLRCAPPPTAAGVS